MTHRERRELEEALVSLEEELEAARDLERATEERHDREGLPETEAVLQARRTRADYLEEERAALAGELRRRTVAEEGWSPDDARGAGSDGPSVRSTGCGRSGSLRIGPHPLMPERGYLLHDRAEETVAWVRRVPSPARAAEILAEHGVEWEEELVSHKLSPVPEGAERR